MVISEASSIAACSGLYASVFANSGSILSGYRPTSCGVSFTQKIESMPTIITAIPKITKAVLNPALVSRIEKPETKKALLRGAPMVAQPRATPFLRGNQSAIRVGATKLNPEAKKQTTIKSST